MAQPQPPILFVAPGNSDCLESIRLLSAERIDYEQHDISRNPWARTQLIKKSGKIRVPTLVWGDDVLSDFKSWELDNFVRAHRSV